LSSAEALRVLWICHYPVFGGPHNYALQLARPLAERGVEIVFLLPDEPGDALDRLRDGGVETVQLPLDRLRGGRDPRPNARLLMRFRREVRAIGALAAERSSDLLLVSGLANPQGAVAAHSQRLPLVWQILDTRTPPALRRAVMPLVRRYADAVMFNGKALIELHCGRRPLRQPSLVFPSPVDTVRHQPSSETRNATRRSLGIPPDALFVGTVANLNPQKGIEFFIRAASIIYRSRPDAWFLIFGSSYETHRRYRERLENEMRGSGVPAERFILRSGRPDDFYPALDVKLITSVPRSEGTTSTAMEAGAAGVPVVATDVGAVSEVVEEGVTGLVVPPQDHRALAEATLRLAADPQLSARMGAVARERAVERYSLEPVLEIYLRAFEAARAHARSRHR
jgi:glycosyltransferase involved in cell wall biosynthesis